MSGNFGACNDVSILGILDLMFFKSTLRKIFKDVVQDSTALDAFYTSEYMILLVVAAIQFPIVLIKKI